MNDRLVNPFSSSGKGFEFYAGLAPSLQALPLVHAQPEHPRSLIKELQTIALEDLLGTNVSDRLMAQAVRAGLLLVADADSSDSYPALVTLQAREIRLLLDYCIRHATNT